MTTYSRTAAARPNSAFDRGSDAVSVRLARVSHFTGLPWGQLERRTGRMIKMKRGVGYCEDAACTES